MGVLLRSVLCLRCSGGRHSWIPRRWLDKECLEAKAPCRRRSWPPCVSLGLVYLFCPNSSRESRQWLRLLIVPCFLVLRPCGLAPGLPHNLRRAAVLVDANLAPHQAVLQILGDTLSRIRSCMWKRVTRVMTTAMRQTRTVNLRRGLALCPAA